MIRHSKKLGLLDASVAIYQEIKGEIASQNEVQDDVEEDQRSGQDRDVIVLSYGFFSSRKSALSLKRMLEDGGYEVLIPRLPGFFGVLNTDGVARVADVLELECRRLQASGRRYHVVGYSKGALVASYMFARAGGAMGATSYISMAAPYMGSRLTYLLLFTPLGLFWRDVWDMRPGSEVIGYIKKNLPALKKSLPMASIYGKKYMVSGTHAKIDFMPNEQIETDLTHFDFLSSEAVAGKILGFVDRVQGQLI